MEHYEMLVIGSGPSGRRAAIQSAKLGKSVLARKGSGSPRLRAHRYHPLNSCAETVYLSGWREGALTACGTGQAGISIEDWIQRRKKAPKGSR